MPASGPRVFNDNWRDTQAAAIEGSEFAPEDDRESAILQTLAPGAYTAIVGSADNSTGVALVELYDLDPGSDSQPCSRICPASKSIIKYVPYDEAYESGFEDMPRRVPDLTRIKGLIGYEPKHDLDDILVQVIDHFRRK